MSELTILWSPPAGNGPQLGLSGQNEFKVIAGDAGWYMPPTSLILDYYEQHAMVSRVRLEPRLLDLPIYVDAASQAAFDAAIDTLCMAFNPVGGRQGTLTVIRHDGEVREISGIYFTGLQGVRSMEMYHQTWIELPLVLKCLDPAWYNPTPQSFVYNTGSVNNFFPMFPLDLNAESVFGNTIVTNNGTLDSWPVWTVEGPGTNPLFENLDTGKKLQLTVTLSAGQFLVVDTRPGHKSITIDGANHFNKTSVDSSLWPLIPGDNTIKVSMSGTTAASEVSLDFLERYLSL